MTDELGYEILTSAFKHVKKEEFDPEDLYSIDVDKFISYISERLTDREKLVIDLRYEEHFTYDKIGEQLKVTRGRAQQIGAKALRKLYYTATLRCRKGGFAEKESAEEEAKDKETDIGELGLSVRSYNCLRHAGIYTIEQLSELTKDDFMKIRGLGASSIEDILKRASEYGVVFTKWAGKLY